MPTTDGRDFTGQVVLITGGTRGLGRAMADGFGRAGATLVIASRHQAACEQTCEELRAAWDVPATARSCHVGSWTDCDQLLSATMAEHGRIDVLINNAGMSPLYETLPALTYELASKVFDVNALGPLRLAVGAAEAMRSQGGGAIVNISSVSSLEPHSFDLPYAMAKAALNCLTVGLAKTYGPLVRVNGLIAGAFRTDSTKAWTEDIKREVSDRTALGRLGEADEIVGAALYLANSSAASYTSGSLLKIDGGLTPAPA